MKKKYHLSPKPSKSINTSEATDQLFDSPEYQYIESPASASHSPATKDTNDYLKKQNGSKKTTYIPPPGFPPSGMRNAGSSISSKEYEDPNYAEVQDLGSGQEDEVYAELYECPSTEQRKVDIWVANYSIWKLICGNCCFPTDNLISINLLPYMQVSQP